MRTIALFLLTACSTVDFAPPVAEGMHRVDASSPEAFGVVALLNDAGTTRDLLDHGVNLDLRAARSLIVHRDGPDGVFGTQDDDLFDDIAEVDAQYYVGNAALVRLLGWAKKNGWIPAGGDVVGQWEGVSFTSDEVLATLELANTASEVVLDDELHLDRRAAASIVAGRPFSHMNGLAAAKFVGQAALHTLREHVAAASLSGPWEPCDTAADCEEGLVCMGELAWGHGIQCVDDTMYDAFNHDEANEIPDDGSTLSTSVRVQGLATVPVDVQITLDIDHPRPSDLVISIDNFNGYGETLWANDSAPQMVMVVHAFPSDDMVNGIYTVHVTDTVPGAVGELRGWELYIVSNWD